MRIVVVCEAIPPYCGGAEQVAWVHAVGMAIRHDVTVITFGEDAETETRDGVTIQYMPATRRKLFSYLTTHRALLNKRIDSIRPDIIHCHMPNVLSACLKTAGRILITTIHDGVPEDERVLPWFRWIKFKLLRRINLRKSHVVTCVSRHNRERMRRIYPAYADKFVFIPNPIHERLFSSVAKADDGYVLNFGRQIKLKMGALIDVARIMPKMEFKFVGVGDMVVDYALANVEFVGFSDSVEEYIDRAAICVFPSESENFPLVGLEAMARGKPVIASKRGFSEYIEHCGNGILLESIDAHDIAKSIRAISDNEELRSSICHHARKTAEKYRPTTVVAQYEELYNTLLTPQSRLQ